MKRILGIILTAIICIGVLTACNQQQNASESENKPIPSESQKSAEEQNTTAIVDKPSKPTEKQNTTITVDEFCKKVDGVWGYKNEDDFWECLEFKNKKISDFTYQGHSWLSDGDITSLNQISNYTVTINISYMEIIMGEEESTWPTKETTYTFKSNDNYNKSLIRQRDDGSEWSYTYIGSSLEEAYSYMDNNYESQTQGSTHSSIPKVSTTSEILGYDFNVIKTRMGNALSPQWHNYALELFSLKNTNNITYYFNTDATQNKECIGTANGTVEFWGLGNTVDSTTRVKDIINDELLITNPAIYKTGESGHFRGSSGFQAYVWEMPNGYIVIINRAFGNNFYEALPYQIMHVKDLSCLDLVK